MRVGGFVTASSSWPSARMATVEVLSRGCGSNVITQAGAPSWSAATRTRSINARCPRCTPSKLPMVSAHGVRLAGLGSPRKTRMEAEEAMDEVGGRLYAAGARPDGPVPMANRRRVVAVRRAVKLLPVKKIVILISGRGVQHGDDRRCLPARRVGSRGGVRRLQQAGSGRPAVRCGQAGIATAVVDPKVHAVARRLRGRADRRPRSVTGPTASCWPASCASFPNPS